MLKKKRSHAAERKANVADENVCVQKYLRAVRGEVEPVPLPSRSPPATHGTGGIP